MENSLGEDLPVGIYRSNDKIKNLKIRVKVRKIANACFTEKDPLVFGNPNELELVNMMKAPSAKAEKIFSWQEKVDENQQNKADDDKENNHHKKDSLVIFLTSYTDSDILTKNWKNKSATVPILESSHLENQIAKLKPKMRQRFQFIETGQRPLFAGAKNLIKEKSSTKDIIQIGQSMVIMAIIHFDDGSPSEEIQLCSLQIDDHGTLTVIPDFTKQKSYIFLNSRSETFEYEIENVSPILKDSAIEREKYLIKKIAQYKKKIKAEKLGTEISQVSSETLIQINCEIVAAKNFTYPDIFIHYTVILPKGWNSESELEGVTETCKSKWKNGVNISYYGYLFSLTVKPNDVTQENDSEKESFKVIFEATSVDFWGNFRNEGYGYADIMLSPGMNINNVYMWKLEPITLKDKLQYFFIGGMPTLDDLSYVIKPKDIKDEQLSKYGLRTITSGSVEFQSSIIIQS